MYNSEKHENRTHLGEVCAVSLSLTDEGNARRTHEPNIR